MRNYAVSAVSSMELRMYCMAGMRDTVVSGESDYVYVHVSK